MFFSAPRIVRVDHTMMSNLVEMLAWPSLFLDHVVVLPVAHIPAPRQEVERFPQHPCYFR